MHDFAVERPNCVNEPENYLFSDCGSTAWAYTLFISFNIISMYIFTNMFIVVVMHNFSYVYQVAPGFSLITREEIRRYKRHWAEVDHDNTGYIQEEDLTKFLMVGDPYPRNGYLCFRGNDINLSIPFLIC